MVKRISILQQRGTPPTPSGRGTAWGRHGGGSASPPLKGDKGGFYSPYPLREGDSVGGGTEGDSVWGGREGDNKDFTPLKDFKDLKPLTAFFRLYLRR